MKSLYLILPLFFYVSGICQFNNLLLNGGFEFKKTNESWPDGMAQCDRMLNWESRTSDATTHAQYKYLHSPDWLNLNGSGIQCAFNVPGPHMNYGYIGMTNYELIQQPLPTLEVDKLYTVSMYVNLVGLNYYWQNSSIRCYLSTNGKFKYKNENIFGPSNQDACDYCTKDYAEFSGPLSEWMEIGGVDLNLNSYPASGWHRISFTFRAPQNSNSNSNYFAIQLVQDDFDPDATKKSDCNNGDYSNMDKCEDGYVFIDDVVIEKAGFCNSVCAANLGSVTHTSFFNAIVATEVPCVIYVKNAIGIDFNIYNTWNSNTPIYSQSAIDVNGLKDVGYDDYLFGWVGKKSDGTLLSQNDDVFVYSIKIWNCDQEVNYTGSLTYIVGNYDNSQPYDIHNENLKDCCPDDLYIQNKIYPSGLTVEAADNFITIGSNVTGGTTGPVIVGTSSQVKFVSASINMMPGFSVLPGAIAEFIPTSNCPYAIIRRAAPLDRNRPEYSKSRTFDFQGKENLLIVPNPNNGIFTINSPMDNFSLQVTDINGRVILEESRIVDRMKHINIKNEPSGVYFVKIQAAGKVEMGKILKQ